MCSILVVVADVVFHRTFQVLFFKHDHKVEWIPAAVADKAFCNSLLSWTLNTYQPWLYTEVFYGFDHHRTEARTAIKDQIGGCRIVGKRLIEPLNNPSTSGYLVKLKIRIRRQS